MRINSDGTLSALQNKEVYLSEAEIIMDPDLSWTNSDIVPVWPILEDKQEPVTVHISVTGTICDDQIEKKEIVKAYIDILLQP